MKHAQIQDQRDDLRILVLNARKKLVYSLRTLDEHKRFVLAVGSGEVLRIEALVRVALRQNVGIAGILKRTIKAAKGLYKPKDYTEQERMQAIVMYRFGGARVAAFAHKALGLPSLSAIQNHSRDLHRTLRLSPTKPCISEVEFNIEATFPVTQHSGICHDTRDTSFYVLMIDELKIEERLRWDPDTNKIVGLCREHSGTCSLDFCSVEDLEVVCDAISNKEVHVATEVCMSSFIYFSD